MGAALTCGVWGLLRLLHTGFPKLPRSQARHQLALGRAPPSRRSAQTHPPEVVPPPPWPPGLLWLHSSRGAGGWGRPAAARPPSLGGPGPGHRAASGPEAGLTPMLPVTRSSRPQGSTPPSGSYRASLTGLLPLWEAQRGGPSATRGCPRAVQSPPCRRGAPIRKAGSAGSRQASVLPCWGDDLQNCPSVLSAGTHLDQDKPQDEELQELACCSPGDCRGQRSLGVHTLCRDPRRALLKLTLLGLLSAQAPLSSPRSLETPTSWRASVRSRPQALRYTKPVAHVE